MKPTFFSVIALIEFSHGSSRFVFRSIRRVCVLLRNYSRLTLALISSGRFSTFIARDGRVHAFHCSRWSRADQRFFDLKKTTRNESTALVTPNRVSLLLIRRRLSPTGTRRRTDGANRRYQPTIGTDRR